MKVSNIILLFCLLILGCNSEQTPSSDLINNKKGLDNTNKYKLVKSGTISFPLDSVTSTSSQIQFFKDERKSFLALLNKNNNTIYLYSYGDTRLVKKIKFDSQGPNSTGRIRGFYFHNLDSLFIHGGGSARLYLSNLSGIINNKYDLTNSDPESQGNVLPSSYSTGMPMSVRGGFLYMNSWGTEREYYNNKEFKNSLLLKLDLKSGRVQHIMRYPDSYAGTGVWGIQLYIMWNAFNSKTKDIILSLPIDHNIYVIDSLDRITPYYAGSNEIDYVQPLSQRKRFQPASILDEVRHQETQSIYHSVYTDSNTGFSLRFVNKKMGEEDHDNKHPVKSKNQLLSIVILDPAYNKVGESQIGGFEYFANPSFFNDNGFHINKGKYTYEDNLVFDLYKIVLGDEK